MTDGITCYRIVFEHFISNPEKVYQPEKIWRVTINIPHGNTQRLIVRYYDSWAEVESLIKQSNPCKEVLAYSELTSTTTEVLSSQRN